MTRGSSRALLSRKLNLGSLSDASKKNYVPRRLAHLDDTLIAVQFQDHQLPPHKPSKMPPKRVYIQQKSSATESEGTVKSAFEALTSQENRAVVTSIAAFGVRLFLSCCSIKQRIVL